MHEKLNHRRFNFFLLRQGGRKAYGTGGESHRGVFVWGGGGRDSIKVSTDAHCVSSSGQLFVSNRHVPDYLHDFRHRHPLGHYTYV